MIVGWDRKQLTVKECTRLHLPAPGTTIAFTTAASPPNSLVKILKQIGKLMSKPNAKSKRDYLYKADDMGKQDQLQGEEKSQVTVKSVYKLTATISKYLPFIHS